MCHCYIGQRAGVLLLITLCCAIAPVGARTASAQENQWCGFGCSSGDWGDPFNWSEGLPVDPQRAIIDGTFDGAWAGGPGVDAVTATIGAMTVEGFGTVNIGNGATLTTTGSSFSLLGPAFGGVTLGDGTVNISGTGTWLNEGNNIWLGDSENGAGTINMSDDSVLDAAGGINVGIRSNGTVNLSGNASLTAASMILGLDADLGTDPDVVLTIADNAALNVSGSVVAGINPNSVNVTMTGGTLSAGSFTWNATGGAFNFSGGSIVVQEDSTDIITQPWFNDGGSSAAIFDGTQTTIQGEFSGDVNFGEQVTGDASAAIATNSPLDTVTFDTPHSVTLTRIDVPSGPATINVMQGDQIIDSDVTLNGNTNVNVTGGSLELRGNVDVANGTFGSGANLSLAAYKTISGTGELNSTVTAARFSTVSAVGGDLAVGDANAVNGFYSNGTLLANDNTLSLNDANDAGLDSGAWVDLGSAGTGRLAAPNGLTLDFAGNITGAGTIDTPDDPAKPFINQGNVVGTGSGITTTGYVKGVGTFDNVTHEGTYAPGLSPARVQSGSVTYDGTLEIEIGGSAAGQFDQIDHVLGRGVATLGGTLDIDLIDRFQPQQGDRFEILTATGRIDGTFDTELFPTLDAGLAWQIEYLPQAVTLGIIPATVPEPAGGVLIALAGMLLVLRSGRRGRR